MKMTNEEAIQVLNMVEAHGLADEAKKLAIEALEVSEHISKSMAELKRLQGLESHMDSYESDAYSFAYFEVEWMGSSSINILDLKTNSYVEELQMECKMSHELFVEWCKRWEAEHED